MATKASLKLSADLVPMASTGSTLSDMYDGRQREILTKQETLAQRHRENLKDAANSQLCPVSLAALRRAACDPSAGPGQIAAVRQEAPSADGGGS